MLAADVSSPHYNLVLIRFEYGAELTGQIFHQSLMKFVSFEALFLIYKSEGLAFSNNLTKAQARGRIKVIAISLGWKFNLRIRIDKADKNQITPVAKKKFLKKVIEFFIL